MMIRLPDIGEYSLEVGLPAQARTVWPAVKDVAPKYFADHDRVYDSISFEAFVNEAVAEAIVFHRGEDLVGMTFIQGLQVGYKACFHAFAAPAFRSPETSTLLGLAAVIYWFERYGLHRLETVGRMSNRTARLCAARLGFRREGVLRSYAQHGGEWQDYYLGSIIRGEL